MCPHVAEGVRDLWSPFGKGADFTLAIYALLLPQVAFTSTSGGDAAIAAHEIPEAQMRDPLKKGQSRRII